MAQPNKGFEFNTWVGSPLTNRNSSIPLDSSGNLTVNRYGVFTVNFKPLPPPIPPEYLYLIISVIISSLVVAGPYQALLAGPKQERNASKRMYKDD